MHYSTPAPIVSGVIAVLSVGAGRAEAVKDPHVRRGRNFVQIHCARCHAAGRAGGSPLAEAPRFRDLHTRYPVTDLAESLVEGIRTGHPSMPKFQLDPDQVKDVLRYLTTLEH